MKSHSIEVAAYKAERATNYPLFFEEMSPARGGAAEKPNSIRINESLLKNAKKFDTFFLKD